MLVRRTKSIVIAVTAALVTLSLAPAFAQAPPPGGAPPPLPPPAQLDQLVARIALYPDPLLAQVLAASTLSRTRFHQAAAWADEHHYLTGQALAERPRFRRIN